MTFALLLTPTLTHSGKADGDCTLSWPMLSTVQGT